MATTLTSHGPEPEPEPEDYHIENKNVQESQTIEPHPIEPQPSTSKAVPLVDPIPESNLQASPAVTSPPTGADTSVTSPIPEPDERWWLKKILWPPFPARGCDPRPVSILLQNTNGPCSLLAICNILLLRGSITLPGPPERNSISFQTLSSILADYLVRQSHGSENLGTALSIIPSTRTGLDLNPRFGSIDGFSAGSGEVELFSSAGVPLVHGWVVDSQDTETWDVLVTKCGDYDKAIERVAVGEELFEKSQIPDQELSVEDREIIQDASLIRRFLDTSSTQLSYFGLFQLVSVLPPDSLTALFRNSHLSVLYRRPVMISPPSVPLPPPLPPPPDQIDPSYSHETMLEVHAIAQSLAQVELDGLSQNQTNEDEGRIPKLFSLVTDMSFLNEPHIVWESLEDVEGGLSEFYDWDLTRSQLRSSLRPAADQRHGPNLSTHGNPPNQSSRPNHYNQDFLCAQQLQQEEYRKQEARRHNQHASNLQAQPHHFQPPPSSHHLTPTLNPTQPNPQPHHHHHHSGHPNLPEQSNGQAYPATNHSGHHRHASSGVGQKKKNCTIM